MNHPIITLVFCIVYLSMTGCTLFTRDLETLREGQAQQQSELQQQRVMLEQQSEQLQSLAEVQHQLKTELQSRNVVVVSKSSRRDRTTKVQSTKQVVNVDGKLLLGRVEWAWLNQLDRPLKARIDTGVGISSLQAQQVEEFERDGKRWVRYMVVVEEKGVSERMEAPLVRYARIRQSSNEDMERRPVIRLTLRLGQLTEETEFTLSDRTGMLYPILLGREFLRDIAIVDVARKFVQPKPADIESPEAAPSVAEEP